MPQSRSILSTLIEVLNFILFYFILFFTFLTFFSQETPFGFIHTNLYNKKTFSKFVGNAYILKLQSLVHTNALKKL